ncbi:MAG TPA: MFS transporter [Actinomycetota bacterium]|nr:MFS transporter [Actinomycetota bacterium]
MEFRESAAAGLPQRGLRSTFRLLRRNPAFTRLYAAQLISMAGDWFLIVALYGLALELTGSALAASGVLVAHLVPFFLVSPFGGVLADRLDRRRLMIAADVLRAGVCVGFLVIDRSGEIWLMFVLIAGLSSLNALFDPAATAAVPNLVDPEDLPAANVLSGSAWGAMLAVGAALGGLIAGVFGRETAFLVDAGSFVASAALLLTVRRAFSEAREGEHPSLRAAIVETVRYARGDRRVTALLAVKGGFGLGGGVIGLLPVFATQVFGGGDGAIGVLLAARGLGALVGPFLARRWVRNEDHRLFSAIASAMALFGVFYLVFPLAGSLAVAAPLAAGAHLGGGAQWTLSTYGLQVVTPDRIRGRVFAFDFMLVTASMTVSSLLAGWAAGHAGPRVVMAVLAAVALAYALIWAALTKRLRAGLRAGDSLRSSYEGAFGGAGGDPPA